MYELEGRYAHALFLAMNKKKHHWTKWNRN